MHAPREGTPAAHNVFRYSLPPYAPELNAIEPVFRAVKHLDLPERRCRTTADLLAAGDPAFTRVASTMIGQCHQQPRPAA